MFVPHDGKFQMTVVWHHEYLIMNSASLHLIIFVFTLVIRLLASHLTSDQSCNL